MSEHELLRECRNYVLTAKWGAETPGAEGLADELLTKIDHHLAQPEAQKNLNDPASQSDAATNASTEGPRVVRPENVEAVGDGSALTDDRGIVQGGSIPLRSSSIPDQPEAAPVAWRYRVKPADRWALTDVEPWAETPYVEPLCLCSSAPDRALVEELKAAKQDWATNPEADLVYMGKWASANIDRIIAALESKP